MKIGIIGVPMDLGASRRGVDMGPSAVRYAHLAARIEELGLEVTDFGDIDVPVIRSELENIDRSNFIPEIRDVCTSLSKKVQEIMIKGFIPLVIGGDHSIAIGTFGGVANAGKNVGLLWFDAHGDFNNLTTSQTGNPHGMPLAVINSDGPEDLVSITEGYDLCEDNIALVGIRDLDYKERQRLKDTDIDVYTISDIDRQGIEEILEKAIQSAGCGTEGVHVSFDVDVLDPLTAPGVGTAVPGGLDYREAHLALEMIAEAGVLASLELVEVNPILDERNRTAELAVELILSCLGKNIL
ncbi:arginase [Acetohalobium arabaticum]|uniref:Arginase n=1 Tax=Acetohalobium arabaticum (strain ATCC 49924 / DSM 5501 / Z-7288) TaxID=574087 RepID=D9QTI4_ACEAZ|nr:arginase [Acetohalobium arabaticum]ADL11748.1 arginase [Acetohalobium arabaticum DSM 5501]